MVSMYQLTLNIQEHGVCSHYVDNNPVHNISKDGQTRTIGTGINLK